MIDWLIGRILENPPLLFLLLGLFTFIVGVNGNVPGTSIIIYTREGQLLVIILAIVFILVGILKVDSRKNSKYTKTTTTKPAINKTNVNGTIEAVMIENNMRKQGRTGLLIHVRFTIQNRKGIRCYLRAHFYNLDGQIIKGTLGSFRNKSGDAFCADHFTPGFDDTKYQDFQLFMPYSGLTKLKGNFTIKTRVSIYDYKTESIAFRSQFCTFNFKR